MTSPEPGGNDEVIRVVYQAVADYSQLLRETARARQETAALKRDLDALAGTSEHKVKVTADAAQAKAQLAEVLRDVVVKIKVTVDAAAAKAELSALLRDVAVKAKVVIDAAAARAEIARTVQNAVVKVKVAVDAAAARAEIARVTRDVTVPVKLRVDDADWQRVAGTFRDRTLEIAVKLDEAGVTARFAALLAHLESMGPVDIEIRIKEDVIDRLDASARRLAEIRDRIQGGGGGPGDPPNPPTPPNPPSPRPGGDKAKLPEGLTTAASFVTTWVPLVAAAVPVAAALAVAVGTVAAAFTAGAATAGIFAVGAVGAFTKVTAAVQAYEKSGTISAGPLGRVVAAFEHLKDRYRELEKATEAPIFGIFTKGLNLAVDLLDKVQPLVKSATAAMSDSFDTVSASLKGPAFDDFLSFVGRQGPDAVRGFTTGIVGFGEGFTNLLEQFEPFIHGFVTGFAQAGQEFDRWASGLTTNTGFQKFLQYGRENLPKVIDLVKNLWAFAQHLFVALEPIGNVLLSMAAGAARFLAAIPPGELTTIITVVLALAAAIKVMQAVIAVTGFASQFSAAIGKIKTAMGGADGAAGGLKGAMAGLAATAIVTAGMIAINHWLQETAKLQDEAADAVSRHAAALAAITQAGGDIHSKATQQQQYQSLIGMSATGAAGGFLGYGQTKETLSFRDVAAAAGISGDQLVTGSLGIDPHVQSQNIGKLEAYRQQLLKQAAAGGANATSLKAQADAVEQLETQYGAQSLAVGEATAATKDNTEATKNAAGAGSNAANAYATQAEATAKVKSLLKSTDWSSDASVTAYNNAVTAMQAYDQQIQAVKDANQALSDAEYDAKRATEATTAARLAAVQGIKDAQRALRDLTLDESQARLSAKEADQNLAKVIANGGTADEIEQAKIDDERAHNALNDLEQDKASKKTAANTTIAKGVEGNAGVIDAERSQAAAVKAVAAARKNLSAATTQLVDLHLAFQTAASALGLSETQVRNLKTNMDKLKDKVVNVTVNTKSAEGKLAKLLQGQYALQELAAHSDMSLAQAMAAAAKQVPTLAAAATTTAPKAAVPSYNVPIPSTAGSSYNFPIPGHAEGGPAVASAVTAGPVHGPGTGTSDSIAVTLPAGGPARLSNGEHIVTDAEVKSAPGGHAYLEAFRAGLRAGRPWAPPGYAGGGRAAPVGRYGPALGWSAVLPAFRAPVAAPALAVPGYAAGGAVAGAAGYSPVTHRAVNIGTINVNNPVAEPASVSLYAQVRKAVDGDDTTAR